MVHAFFIFIFILGLTKWLGFEFPHNRFIWRKQWPLALAAICLPILGSVLSIQFGGKIGNFLLHSIGGGVASACIFTYLTQLLNIKLNWRLGLGAVFMFASALGVLNELAEYAAELLHFGTFSFDTQDTWRDLAANTLGALIGWVIIKAVMHNKKRIA